MTVLDLKNVHAAPWGEPLLHNIQLQVDAGDTLGIVGPNGAGKTSLLNVMAGVVPHSSGSVTLAQRDLSLWKPRERARHMAVLPQQSLLNFPFSVEEVILLGRTPHASGAKKDREILQQVLKATDTAHLREQTYTQLSGGEKQRVQLARVFAQVWREEDAPSRLLLLDEPNTALDLAHQQLILETLNSLTLSGCAAVVVMHDFNLLASVATQVVAIHRGRQHATGSAHEVFTTALFQQVFGVEVSIEKHPRHDYPVVIRG